MEFAYSPIEQFVHVSFEGAPMAAEYVPLLQLVHSDAPAVRAYLPATQSVHSAAAEVQTETGTGRPCQWKNQPARPHGSFASAY